MSSTNSSVDMVEQIHCASNHLLQAMPYLQTVATLTCTIEDGWVQDTVEHLLLYLQSRSTYYKDSDERYYPCLSVNPYIQQQK